MLPVAVAVFVHRRVEAAREQQRFVSAVSNMSANTGAPHRHRQHRYPAFWGRADLTMREVHAAYRATRDLYLLHTHHLPTAAFLAEGEIEPGKKDLAGGYRPHHVVIEPGESRAKLIDTLIHELGHGGKRLNVELHHNVASRLGAVQSHLVDTTVAKGAAFLSPHSGEWETFSPLGPEADVANVVADLRAALPVDKGFGLGRPYKPAPERNLSEAEIQRLQSHLGKMRELLSYASSNLFSDRAVFGRRLPQLHDKSRMTTEKITRYDLGRIYMSMLWDQKHSTCLPFLNFSPSEANARSMTAMMWKLHGEHLLQTYDKKIPWTVRKKIAAEVAAHSSYIDGLLRGASAVDQILEGVEALDEAALWQHERALSEPASDLIRNLWLYQHNQKSDRERLLARKENTVVSARLLKKGYRFIDSYIPPEE